MKTITLIYNLENMVCNTDKQRHIFKSRLVIACKELIQLNQECYISSKNLHLSYHSKYYKCKLLNENYYYNLLFDCVLYYSINWKINYHYIHFQYIQKYRKLHNKCLKPIHFFDLARWTQTSMKEYHEQIS